VPLCVAKLNNALLVNVKITSFGAIRKYKHVLTLLLFHYIAVAGSEGG